MQRIRELREELIELGADQPWENFEATDLGRLTLPMRRRILADGEDDLCYYDFYMRVGTHLGQPMQAMMSCGHFIKMRKETRWVVAQMLSLDPQNPMSSLYRAPPPPVYPQYNIAVDQMLYPSSKPEHWRPDLGGMLASQYYQPQLQQYQYQQQLQQYNQTTAGAGYVYTYGHPTSYTGYGCSGTRAGNTGYVSGYGLQTTTTTSGT